MKKRRVYLQHAAPVLEETPAPPSWGLADPRDLLR